MTSDSTEDGTGLPGGEPLFQIGSTEQRFESLLHSLLLVVGSFLFAGALVAVSNTLLQGANLTEQSAPILSEITTTAVNFLGLGLAALLYLDWRSDWSLIGLRMPKKRDIAVMLAGIIGLVVLIVSLDFLLSQIGLEPDENVAVEVGRENPELFLYYIPIVLLLNAPAEELLFRGVVQGLFRRAYGVVPGIIAASLLFGLVHYVALAGQGSAAAYVAIAFLSGLVLGAVYEFTGNLIVPTIVHAAWNILVYLNLYGQTVGLY